MNWLRALVTPRVTGSHAAAMRSAVPGPRIIGESQCVLFSIVQTVHRLCGCFHQNQWLNVLICRTKLTIMSWRLVLADKEGSLKAGLTAFPRPEDVESQDNQFCVSLSVVLAAGQCCLLHRHTLPIILESAMERTTNSGRRSKAATSFSQETFPAQRSTKSKSASKKPGPKPQTATKTKTAAEGASAGKVVQKTPNPNKKKSSGLANLTCSVTDLTFSQLEEQSVFFKNIVYEAGTGLGDLDARSASINPIFSRSNFVSETLVWPVLEPSLRLASRFLQSVQQRTMIAVMWRARRAKRTIPGEKDNKGSQLERYPNAAIRRAMQDDSDASTLEIDAIMDELSQCIRLDEAKIATEAKARDGTNTQVRAEPLTSQGFTHLDGNGGTIYYDTDMYLDLLKATRTPLKSSDVPNLLILRFQFAITLVHEVMHALQDAIYGELDTDPFHGGDQLAETGFKAECTLFDGQFDVLSSARSPRGRTMVRTSMLSEDIPSELVGIPLVWRWPCRTTMMRYTHYNLGISARKGWKEKLPAGRCLAKQTGGR